VDAVVAAIDPTHPGQSKCTAGKLKCASKKLQGLLKCHQLAATPSKSTDPNAGSCIDKVVLKFDGGPQPAKGCFGKLEGKATNDCLPPTGNVAAVEAEVDACVGDLVAVLTTPTTTSTPASTTSSTSTSPTSLPSTSSTSSTPTSTSTTTTTLPVGAVCDADGVVARIAVSTGNLAGVAADVRYTTVVTFPGNGFDTDPNGDHVSDLTGRGGVLIPVDGDTNADSVDDRLRVTYALAGGATFGPGPWVDVRFDCTPGVPVSSAVFTCTVASASDAGGNPVAGVTCFVQSLQ
jgi:hypothetical protein